MNQQDKSFLTTLTAIIGGLVVVSVMVVVIARIVTGVAERGSGARLAQENALQERIQPVGQVALAGAETEEAQEAADAGASALSAQEVVTQVCAACHQAGVLEAPKIGVKEDWDLRMQAGLDTLVANAINGLNAMPARGGNPNLSDEEIRASVLLMLADSGLDTGEPAAPASGDAEQTAGEDDTAEAEAATVDAVALYGKACAACHDTGAANAPKKGDAAAWADRIAKGTDTLVQHAVNGFNTMPAKGGAMNLSDAEVAAIVEYLVQESQ